MTMRSRVLGNGGDSGHARSQPLSGKTLRHPKAGVIRSPSLGQADRAVRFRENRSGA